MKRLYVFTSSYPYGYRESFLEVECDYLVKEFDEIKFVPYCYDDIVRKMPKGCELLPAEKDYSQKKRMLFNRLSFVPFIKDFFCRRVFLSKIKFKEWLKIYGSVNNLLNSPRMEAILNIASPEDVFYFYWGKGSNALAACLKEKVKMVSRFHGQWDLWEEEYENYSPLRSTITKSLNATCAISSMGRDYLLRKYPDANVKLFPLGSKDFGECIDKSDDDAIRVLSISSVYYIKRVDLIFRSLTAIKDRKVKWTHIGDGVDYEKMKVETEATAHPNLEVNLIGRLCHEKVMEYLKNHKFDVFVNLSVLEGVPVSIMEALSFDIPIVATNVGGTPDIVQFECGKLVSENPSEDEVAETIKQVVEGNYSPRSFWETHYSADVNYGGFAQFLSRL